MLSAKKQRTERLRASDQNAIWHPFTPMQNWMGDKPIIIDRGHGNYLIDTDGKRYLDGVSSLWVTVHGHNHPALNRAIQKQLKKIAHSTFLGLSNVPAIELAEKLVAITPDSLDRVFYSDNGSTSVEIALKIAYQYWQQHRDASFHSKKKFISFTNAYHGDTLGAVSVGGISLFHQIYEPLLFETLKVPYPYPLSEQRSIEDSETNCLKALETCLDKNHQSVAGLIIEPLMQGAAGMIQSSSLFLQQVRRLTAKYNVLLIVDEVATGFGRTGEMFASLKADIQPDILCLAKGLTGGYLPLAATMTTETIFESFLGEPTDHKTFYHGHTFTGNPLACAAALANLKLFEAPRFFDRLQEKTHHLMRGLSEIEKLSHVAEIRQEGLMVGIELYKDVPRHIPYPEIERIGVQVCQMATQHGVYLRPLGDVIVLMPPLSITKKQLNLLLDVTKACIISVTKDE